MSKKEEIDVVDFCKAIQMIHELKQQLAEKDKEIKELKFQIEDKKGGCELCEFSKELRDIDIRHQICEKIRERIVKETCYDTEEEVRNAIYDFNAREVLEILDDIEKGE